MPAVPLILHRDPGAGFDQPFEMLQACHERVERMLVLLLRLADHLHASGNDGSARQAAQDVVRYFDQAGPAHHEDEERHILPLLRHTGLQALAHRLQQEHREMEHRWSALRRWLQRVEQGDATVPDREGQALALRAFADLYRTHIRLEETLAYPAAQAASDAGRLAAMGREMARRRGLTGVAPALASARADGSVPSAAAAAGPAGPPPSGDGGRLSVWDGRTLPG